MDPGVSDALLLPFLQPAHVCSVCEGLGRKGLVPIFILRARPVCRVSLRHYSAAYTAYSAEAGCRPHLLSQRSGRP